MYESYFTAPTTIRQYIHKYLTIINFLIYHLLLYTIGKLEKHISRQIARNDVFLCGFPQNLIRSYPLRKIDEIQYCGFRLF